MVESLRAREIVCAERYLLMRIFCLRGNRHTVPTKRIRNLLVLNRKQLIFDTHTILLYVGCTYMVELLNVYPSDFLTFSTSQEFC